MSVLEVHDVSIRYITGDFKEIGLKEYMMRKLTHNYHVNEFWADRHVSFTLDQGDMLGIIGANGAGKSTLLKAVSGIMEPSEGSVAREGNVVALLELGSGFDGDLTVRENTYLRGAMLGYTRRFMDDTYDDIIDFAELRDFQNRPFKQLSSGMKSRLAFSIASLVRPDILILDEVLSVGDGAFRKKSEEKMREIISGGATTILVSHSLEQVRMLCNKVLWLHKGEQVAFSDDVQGICDWYEDFLAGKRKLPEKSAPTKPTQDRGDMNVNDSGKKLDTEPSVTGTDNGNGVLAIVRNEWSLLRRYLAENRWWILLFSGLLLTVYFPWLINPDLHIDPDHFIMKPGTTWNRLNIGRQGEVLTNILLDMQKYNPYFEGLFGWLMVCAAGVLLGYLCYRASKRNPRYCAAFGLLMFACPIFVEQFYYNQRILVDAVGFILCAAAVWASYLWALKRSRICGILAVVFLVYALSTYDVLATVYIALTVLLFILLYRTSELEQGNEGLPYIPIILRSVVVLVVAYIINTVVTRAFFLAEGSSTGNYMIWGTIPVAESIQRIIDTVKQGVTGDVYYATAFFGVFSVLTVVGACAEALTRPKARLKLLYILAVVGFQVCAFADVIYLGGSSPVRLKILYPLILAGDIIILAGMKIRVGGGSGAMACSKLW